MKNLILVVIFLSVMSIFAQTGSMNMNISAREHPGQSSWESDVHKKAILANLKALEDKYLTQLPKRQYLEASMLVEEIREILLGNSAQQPEAEQVNMNMDINTQTTQNQNQNVNINLDISALQAATGQQTNVVASQPVAESVSVNQPISGTKFQQLVSNISDESFADDQLRYVRTAANSYYFTVAQTTQLIDLFTFAEEKLECLRIVYPKVVDQENAFTIISSFTFESDKKAAELIINQ